MSTEVQVYQQPRSHFEVYSSHIQSSLAFWSKTQGTRLDVEWNWPRDYEVSLYSRIFYMFITILG